MLTIDKDSLPAKGDRVKGFRMNVDGSVCYLTFKSGKVIPVGIDKEKPKKKKKRKLWGWFW